jgi:hypothetical protein
MHPNEFLCIFVYALFEVDPGSVANRIRAAGYRLSEFPLGEFIKAGGAAKSLALRLSDLSVTHRR